MKTLFQPQELWDMVETGFEDENQPLREKRKKDAKALFLIQYSALDKDILSRISALNTAQEAWEILKQEYMESQEVITVKLQTLCQKFEILSMKENESIQEHVTKVSPTMNQMESYSEFLSNKIIVRKVLRSFSLISVIIEANDYTFDEMMSSLIEHENQLRQTGEKAEEKAFQVKGDYTRDQFE